MTAEKFIVFMLVVVVVLIAVWFTGKDKPQ
jgi:hypothetical protein